VRRLQRAAIVLLILSVLTPVWSVSVKGAPPEILTLDSGHLFLPPYATARDRFGFDVAYAAVTSVDVQLLDAGWYSEWRTRLEPSHPAGLTYVQLVRLQAGPDPADPAQVTWLPSSDEIAQIARAHPGSLWMIGNEPDSYYNGSPLLPEVYAHTYYRLAHEILAADPDALLANGAIVQPTPCRLAYLDVVWDTYLQAYGEPMPVDVWNIHAFMLREVYEEWGASTPPGIDPACGTVYKVRDADSLALLRTNVRRFRQWLAQHGEGDKPLIVSEYGILWPYRDDYVFVDEDGNDFNPERVNAYMTGSFDLFLGETDPALGYAEDGNRLVQAWAWYSLADDVQYNGYLYYSGSLQISPMGQAYADYAAALPHEDLPDVAIRLSVDTSPLEGIGPLEPGVTLSIPLTVTGELTNIGRAPAFDVFVDCPALDYSANLTLPARYEPGATLSLSLPEYTVTQPRLIDLTCTADPQLLLADPRRWNNTATASIDARGLFTVNARIFLPLVAAGSR
jgi:hypothetical protein